MLRELDVCPNLYAIKDIVTFNMEGLFTIADVKNKIIEACNVCDYEVVHIEGGTVE